MNNLLRTLTETKAKAAFPEHDLKTLLSTVKEYRRQGQDNRLTDAFYESLENMLLDLRTVTPENHDADAFLKPVLRAEVPDYYDVISHPMDLQTMLKKVKQRQYKSKREFKDDLDLIWSNCFAYNSSENHPLRLCATRLKAKAEKLLKHITDRKPRADPDIPEELANPNATSTHRLSIKLNGHINGHSKHGTPTIKLPTSRVGIATKITSRSNLHSRSPSTANSNAPVLFSDSPALVRTPSGMAAFLEIDRALEMHCNTAPDEANAEAMLDRLKELLPGRHELEDEESEADFIKEENDESVGIATLGNKRKLNGIDHARPRKRIRYSPNLPSRVPVPPVAGDPLSHFWWEQVQSPFLAANAVPHIPFPVSSSSPYPNPGPSKADEKPKPVKRKRRRKNLRSSSASTLVESLDAGSHPRMYKNESKSLLGIMSNNVRTMKRVRHTHAKFVALGLGKDGGEDGEPGPSKVEVESTPRVKLEHLEEEVGILDDRVNERPWVAGLARSSSGDEDDVEVGEKNATDCLHWMGEKMLEHAGFQGTSKVALDVVAGVTSDYLMNVGRTIRYLIDKHGHSMSAEEIILHTLFESGVSKIQDLERYIKDDVERYGSRLGDLEKKLVGAYRDTVSRLVSDNTSATAVEDADEEEGLFDEDDEEETGALARGDFADTLNVDFFGFKEMGLAEEFGLSSLSIPQSLLRGKKRRSKPSAIVKPTEPPPPFPPPPPFVPLSASQVDQQIGLLKSFYMSKVQMLTTPLPPPPPVVNYHLPPLLGPPLPPGPPGQAPNPAVSQAVSGSASAVPSPSSATTPTPAEAPPQTLLPPRMDIIIPDDMPNPVNTKMGPLGQIVKASTTTSLAKKKPKGLGTDASPPKKKKTGMVGVGTGNGRKAKKSLEAAQAQAADAQPPGGGQTPKGQSHTPTPGPVPLPHVVIASA